MVAKPFRSIVLVCTSIILFSCGSSNNTSNPVVTTNLGAIQGVQRYGTVNEYRGIPYAQPLTAQDRWTIAKPVTAWTGTLNATSFGASCPQQRRFDLTEESLIEDCLTLNVTTPINIPSSEKLPVLVWLPGGGFVGGSSNLYRLDKLAHEGRIIVVSMNYRIGALGFMAHPSISAGWNGNIGLEDQRLAMQWVKDNIEAFGGDKTKITIAGESAGAASTCLHLLSKSKTEGLFHQAIPLSYNCLYEWSTLQNSLVQSNITIDSSPRIPIYQRMANELGCTDPSGSLQQLNCMRNKPIAEILAAQGRVSEIVPLFPFGPVINSGSDGTIPLVNYSAYEISRNINRIPILYGGARDELRLYIAYDTIADPSENTADLSAGFRNAQFFRYYSLDPSPQPCPTCGINEEYWSTKRTIIFQEYFGGGPISADGLGSMFSDYNPVVGLSNCTYLRTANAFSSIMPLYQWEFADPDALVLGVGITAGQDPRMALGPVHSAALNYFFPNLSNTSAIDAPNLPSNSQLLANEMVQVWANFVKTGNPQTTRLSDWPKFSLAANSQNVMRFIPDNISLINAEEEHKCSFWRQLDTKLTPLIIQ
jgi:para-nitrobenzyl esterase